MQRLRPDSDRPLLTHRARRRPLLLGTDWARPNRGRRGVHAPGPLGAPLKGAGPGKRPIPHDQTRIPETTPSLPGWTLLNSLAGSLARWGTASGVIVVEHLRALRTERRAPVCGALGVATALASGVHFCCSATKSQAGSGLPVGGRSTSRYPAPSRQRWFMTGSATVT